MIAIKGSGEGQADLSPEEREEAKEFATCPRPMASARRSAFSRSRSRYGARTLSITSKSSKTRGICGKYWATLVT